MNRLIAVAAVVIICLFAVDLAAQGIGRNARKNHDSYKKASEKASKQQAAQAKKGAANAKRDAEKEEAKTAKEERDAEREAAKADRAGARAGEAAEPAEELEDAVPGEVLPRAVKDKALDEAMDEIGLKDAAKRSTFKRLVRGAWDDSEKEDKRYHGAWAKVESNAEKAEAEKKLHLEKLKKIWDECDEKLMKEKVLTDEQLEAWQKLSDDLRTKTNTDIHIDFKSKQPKPAPKKSDKDE